jgi:hypothetical protein
MNHKLLDLPYTGLRKVISGAQTGADQAGLFVARDFQIETGGHIARGYRTALGDDPTLAQFNLTVSSSRDYPPRTRANAYEGDATVRLASNFDTAGEVLTLRYVNAAKKPCLSLLLDGVDYDMKAAELVYFIVNNNVECLNVAGNADRDKAHGFHFQHASKILTSAFRILDEEGLLIKTCPTTLNNNS